jgi:hypothetical protein
MFANSFKMFKIVRFKATIGGLYVKLSTLIWRILLKHAIKMDRVVEFSAVASCACCLYTRGP